MLYLSNQGRINLQFNIFGGSRITSLFLVVYLSAVFFCDFRDGKIYNYINFSGLITALLILALSGNEGFAWVLQGLEVLLIFIPFCFLGGIGGGDAKCFCVIAILLGIKNALILIIITLGMGVIYAFCMRQRRIKLGVFMPVAHILVELLIGGF